ncbi:MAG: hypothetical protein JG780_1862, partial [Thermosipho sp. (in: Bacteria)]|nr:hypothetical protein [Thermosipho sp. (in: thermotogales)]
FLKTENVELIKNSRIPKILILRIDYMEIID